MRMFSRLYIWDDSGGSQLASRGTMMDAECSDRQTEAFAGTAFVHSNCPHSIRAIATAYDAYTKALAIDRDGGTLFQDPSKIERRTFPAGNVSLFNFSEFEMCCRSSLPRRLGVVEVVGVPGLPSDRADFSCRS